MPIKYDFDTPVVDGSHWDAGAEINAIFKDHDVVRVAGNWMYVRTQIRQPPYSIIYSTNFTNMLKAFNGDMIVQLSGGFQTMEKINMEGQKDEGMLGSNVYVEAGGGWQKYNQIRTVRSAGPGINMVQPHAGHAASFTSCELMGSPGVPGVSFPVDEPTTGGLRRVIDCKGGGGPSVWWNGAKTSMMIASDTYTFEINENSMYGVFIGNRFAIPSPLILTAKGLEHAFSCNIISSQVVIPSAGTFYDSSNTDAGVSRPLMSRVPIDMLKIDSETKKRISDIMLMHSASEREGEQLRYQHMKSRLSQARPQGENVPMSPMSHPYPISGE
jgi:hypothetical protein